ncbi:MAG: secretin N-terminal domain-containing protein [Pyrinomonadaceae bacterium]
MKKSIQIRFFVSLVLLLSLMSPVTTLAFADGKKYFKEGMKHEVAEEWDKAVEQFALAVSDSPKNPEYRLHLMRSLFNASQMFMKKGTTAAKEKDYEGAYLAFRRSYAFDPTNELAKSEMDRMVRLHQGVIDANGVDTKDSTGKVKLVPTGYVPPTTAAPQMPQKLERLRDLSFPTGVDLQSIIKELARDLDLNVLFDVESFRTARRTIIDIRNVTPARALDYIFLQEGLFFQKVGPRTILVAPQAQRTKFQQLVLRTFYLANAAPKDIAKVVQTAIPAQPGRSQTTVLTDDATNSITIRDTEENIRLIGKLIASLDKDRAEVVMDVAIYEVNKNDLLQLGNQVGSQSQLTALGGTQPGQVLIGGKGLVNTAVSAASALLAPTAFATGIILPSATLSAFQSKNDSKLLASTQIHAFNNEDSSARIGQRVPVQSAQFLGVGAGTNPGNQFGQTANVINYEQVGLTLKFKPIVFPNQDVQVAMEIESKDVAGAGTLTPTFTERTIKGTARIQNNKTLLLASVAQGVESRGRQGLPLLGLIPILGRLFTAPTRDNRQVDIVIAVTPRVIRAPAIMPEDEVERPTGSMAVPTNSSLEAMIVEEEREETLAAARRMPTVSVVQLTDRQPEAPQYVKTDAPTTTATHGTKAIGSDAANVTSGTAAKAIDVSTTALRPIETGVKTLQLNQTSDTSVAAPTETQTFHAQPATAEPKGPRTIELQLGVRVPEMKTGEKARIPIIVHGDGTFRSAVMGLKFDNTKVAVRNVSFGDVFGSTMTNTSATPFLNDKGKMYVSLTGVDGKEMTAKGTLAFIELEALVDGRPSIAFDKDVLNFLTADGKNFTVKLQDSLEQ